jgi:hypothetical protein
MMLDRDNDVIEVDDHLLAGSGIGGAAQDAPRVVDHAALRE